MVPLPNNFVRIKFFEPNSALVAFDMHLNCSIFLSDLSTYNKGEPTSFVGHKAPVTNIQVFLDNFFVSMDSTGVCKVWSIKNTPLERRRTSNRYPSMNSHRRARKSFSATYDQKTINEVHALQTFHNPNENDPIQTIVTVMISNYYDNEHKLYAATRTGRILTYRWNTATHLYEIIPAECFDTTAKQIQSLLHLAPILIMLDGAGKIYFYDLKHTSMDTRRDGMPYTSRWNPPNNPISLHFWRTYNNLNHILAVFSQRIISISYRKMADNLLLTDFDVLYKPTEKENTIVCSTMSDDGKYLVLGTRKGIVVYDPIERIEILRSHVSEHINTLDLCSLSLDNHNYKYVLISGTKQSERAIIFNGLEMARDKVIQWASNRLGSPINDSNFAKCGDVNLWLCSELYEVENINRHDYSIVAVDSLRQVHRKTYNNGDTIYSSDPFASPITAIALRSADIYIGCENGIVYEIKESQSPIVAYMTLPNQIQYLAAFGNALIASTQVKYQIRIGDDTLEYNGKQVVKTFRIDSFLLIVRNDCSFDVSCIRLYVMSFRLIPSPNNLLLYSYSI